VALGDGCGVPCLVPCGGCGAGCRVRCRVRSRVRGAECWEGQAYKSKLDLTVSTLALRARVLDSQWSIAIATSRVSSSGEIRFFSTAP
jgi:hypothetical protein